MTLRRLAKYVRNSRAVIASYMARSPGRYPVLRRISTESFTMSRPRTVAVPEVANKKFNKVRMVVAERRRVRSMRMRMAGRMRFSITPTVVPTRMMGWKRSTTS